MKTEDLKRYGYELPRNGVANDLRTRVSELESALSKAITYHAKLEVENRRLRGLLSELVQDTGVKYDSEGSCFFCDTCHAGSWSRDGFVHADDCAWWNAVRALGSE